MSNPDIVRAWKDPAYRATLDEAPANPAGLIELSDDQLASASGLAAGKFLTTAMTCTEYTWRRWRACCP